MLDVVEVVRVIAWPAVAISAIFILSPKRDRKVVGRFVVVQIKGHEITLDVMPRDAKAGDIIEFVQTKQRSNNSCAK